MSQEKETEYQRRKVKKQYKLYMERKKLHHTELIKWLNSTDSMKREQAVHEMQLRSSKIALKDCIKLCWNPNPILRESAALILGQFTFPDTAEGKATLSKVVALLNEMATEDPRALVRSGALCALGHRARMGADPAIILHAAKHGSRDRSCNVRFAASNALNYINIPGAETVLLRLLRDKDSEVRDWAPLRSICRSMQKIMCMIRRKYAKHCWD